MCQLLLGTAVTAMPQKLDAGRPMLPKSASQGRMTASVNRVPLPEFTRTSAGWSTCTLTRAAFHWVETYMLRTRADQRHRSICACTLL